LLSRIAQDAAKELGCFKGCWIALEVWAGRGSRVLYSVRLEGNWRLLNDKDGGRNQATSVLSPVSGALAGVERTPGLSPMGWRVPLDQNISRFSIRRSFYGKSKTNS
jgi:hypothetical protein